MRLFYFVVLILLSACADLPFILEDVAEVIEIEESNRHLVFLGFPWWTEESEQAQEFREKSAEEIRQYEDYYWYHFG